MYTFVLVLPLNSLFLHPCRFKPHFSKAEPKSTIANFFGGATAVLAPPSPRKDSSSIDVPPLSQLDSSVLDALPDSIRHEILTEYASKTAKKTSLQEHTEEVTLALPPKKEKYFTQSLGVIVANESVFLTEFRNYMEDWILHYVEGPPEEDLLIFSDYVVKLSIGNLDLTSLVLKTMRRFVARVELLSWYSIFNQLLETVQQSVTEQYNGQLKIYPIKQHVSKYQ